MRALVRHGGHRFRRYFRGIWLSRGGGFYGFVGTITFIYLEVLNFYGDVVGLPQFHVSMSGVIGWLVQNLVQGILNLVWSSIWPVVWIQRFGVSLTTALLLGGAYVGFHVTRPLVLRLLREPGEEI